MILCYFISDLLTINYSSQRLSLQLYITIETGCYVLLTVKCILYIKCIGLCKVYLSLLGAQREGRSNTEGLRRLEVHVERLRELHPLFASPRPL